VSAYIRRNVISITDGQIIYLQPELFNAGCCAGGDVGISVSRGGKTLRFKAIEESRRTLPFGFSQTSANCESIRAARNGIGSLNSANRRGYRSSNAKTAEIQQMDVIDQRWGLRGGEGFHGRRADRESAAHSKTG